MILQLVLSWFVIIIMYIVCVRCRIQVGNGQLGNYQRGHVYILNRKFGFQNGNCPQTVLVHIILLQSSSSVQYDPMWPVNMTCKMKVWLVKSSMRPDIVRGPPVNSSSTLDPSGMTTIKTPWWCTVSIPWWFYSYMYTCICNTNGLLTKHEVKLARYLPISVLVCLWTESWQSWGP